MNTQQFHRLAMKAHQVAIVLFSLLICPFAIGQELPDDNDAPTTIVAVNQVADVSPDKFGSAKNVHQCGNLIFAGQFANEDLVKIADASVERVITLRAPDEIDWNEKKAVESARIEHVEVPFRAPDTLTDEVFDQVRELLKDSDKRTFFHCGSANRVGAVWLPYRVLDQGVPIETAIAEAKTIGLRSTAYQTKALNYVTRKQAERENATESVNPGINKTYLSNNLDVDSFIQRFELESREIYAAREEIVAACNLKPSDRVADIGAGTGLFTRMFAKQHSESGWVYAVDIAPRFIEHINESAEKEALGNITSVLCTSKSTNLPPESVDVVFVCDTYHHFEYPSITLKSINSALKPDGQLIVIDFERIPDKSREWIVNHVRAGKEVFRAEIQDAGFELVEEVKISDFKENYFLRFRKSK